MSDEIKFGVHHVFDAAKAASHLNWLHIDRDGNYTLTPSKATSQLTTAQDGQSGVGGPADGSDELRGNVER